MCEAFCQAIAFPWPSPSQPTQATTHFMPSHMQPRKEHVLSNGMGSPSLPFPWRGGGRAQGKGSRGGVLGEGGGKLFELPRDGGWASQFCMIFVPLSSVVFGMTFLMILAFFWKPFCTIVGSHFDKFSGRREKGPTPRKCCK